MIMHPRSLHLDGGESISVNVARTDKTTLIECQNPRPFLEHITHGRWSAALTPDTYLRGCILPNEGALFTLCDQFGTVADEIVRLTNKEAQELIFDRLS